MPLDLRAATLPDLRCSPVVAVCEGDVICACSGITRTQIVRTVAWMQADDPGAVITPARIYRALGKRPNCGSCFTDFLAVLPTRAATWLPSDNTMRADAVL